MATTSFGGAARHGELADLGLDQHLQYAYWSQGTTANRPAAGRAGRFYYATDTGYTHYDLGTSWATAVYPSVPTGGGTMTGNLWINVDNASTGTATTANALRIGTRAGVMAYPGSNPTTGTGQATFITDNLYYDGTTWRYANTSPSMASSFLAISGGSLGYSTAVANTGAAGAAASMVSTFAVSSAGDLTVDGVNAAIRLGYNVKPTNDSERVVIYRAATQTQQIISVRDVDGSARAGLSGGGTWQEKDSVGALRRVLGSWGQFDAHQTFTDFNATTMDFGGNYIGGNTNGPSALGGVQYYNMNLSLGSQYPYTQYVAQMCFPRLPLGGNPGIGLRFRENGTWGSWYVIESGMKLLGGINVANSNIGSGTAGAFNGYGGSFTIVAPTSGKVKVTVAAYSTSSAYQHLFSLSGLPASGHGYAVAALYDSNYGTWGANGSYYVGGLTPGGTYTCQPVIYSSNIAGYIWNWSYTVEG